MSSFQDNSIEKIENKENTQKIDVSDFSNDKIGRGVWHSWHRTGFKATSRSDVIVIYAFILLYVNNMICKICNDHAKEYISKTDYIVEILENHKLTDSEVIEEFNIWLYNFHRHANMNAGKSSPSYEEVANFYLGLEVCHEGCGK